MAIGLMLLVVAMFVLRAVFPYRMGASVLSFAFAVVFLAAGANLWTLADYMVIRGDSHSVRLFGLIVSLLGVLLSAGQFQSVAPSAPGKKQAGTDDSESGK